MMRTMHGEARIHRSTTFSGAQVDELRALVERAQAADGTPPFDDELFRQAVSGQTEVTVTASAADSAPVASPAAGFPAGAAFVAHQGDRLAAELLVDPDLRDQGFGGALIAEVLAAADGELWVWSHGDHPAARALAARHHLERARELLQLRRPGSAPVPDAPAPEGATIRTFVPGQDEHAWVSVNAAAFADHPEQGSRTVEDIRAAETEPWFDPAGFFLAVDADGQVVGFHWTKVHQPAADNADAAPVGEVYVLGVAPESHGTGVGAHLAAVGLRHLADKPGIEEIMLYVEGDNHAALRVYERLGFTRHAIDVAYRRPLASSGD